MVIKKHLKISRDDALRYIILETTVFKGIIASVLSSLVACFAIFYLIYITQFFDFALEEFFVVMGIFFVVGIAVFFIKREEYRLYEKTSSEVFTHGLFTYPLYILLFTGIFLYFLVPQWAEASVETEHQMLASVVTVFLVSILFSYLFNGIWRLLAFFILKLISGQDWVLLAERDFFISGLAMRFEEAKRYGTSLSLVNLTINGISNRNKQLLQSIYRKMVDSLREIDAISHYESWSNIVILAPITGKAAEGMVNRLVRVIRDEIHTKNYKETVTVESRIGSVKIDTETEFDLFNAESTLKHEIQV
jgi:GGDEF domain-containing protein